MVDKDEEDKHNKDMHNELPRQSDEPKTKQILENNTKIVEVENWTKQMHTLELSFDNEEDGDYIKKKTNPISNVLSRLRGMNGLQIIVRST